MKTNLVVVGLLNQKAKEYAAKLAEIFDLYYADMDAIMQYYLLNTEEDIEKVCGKDYLNSLKKRTIKEVSCYENSLISMSHELFLSENKGGELNKYGTILFLDFDKSVVKKLIDKEKDESVKKDLQVLLIAYDEKAKVCRENSDIVVNIKNIDKENNFLKIKKNIENYYL